MSTTDNTTPDQLDPMIAYGMPFTTISGPSPRHELAEAPFVGVRFGSTSIVAHADGVWTIAISLHDLTEPNHIGWLRLELAPDAIDLKGIDTTGPCACGHDHQEAGS